MMERIPEEQRARIMELHEQGRSKQAIADELGITAGRVAHVLYCKRTSRVTKASRIREMVLEGVPFEDICYQVSCDERYVREVVRKMRGEGVEVTLSHRRYATGGPKSRAASGTTKERSVRGMLDEGMDASAIAQNRHMSVDDVRRIQGADEMGLDSRDVPPTWAGAFRRLAEEIRARDPEAFEFARRLAGAKGVAL